jgi:signal transduction histidine kinase/CheY-like chemotaxis protein
VALADEPPRVVVLNSYHRGFTWTDQETDGILAGLRARWPSLQPDVLHLDAKRSGGAVHEAAVLGLLAARRGLRPFDLVVTTDDAALDLALRRRSEIAGDAAIAFCGVNRPPPEGVPRIAGLLEDVDIPGTLELIRALQPRLARLVVVLDGTDTSETMAAGVRTLLAGLADPPALQIVRDRSLPEVEALVAALGRGDAVLLGSFARDPDGRIHAYEEVALRVSSASGAPVYGLRELQLGRGIVGGSLLSGVRHGRRAAELAVALAEGRPAEIERGVAPLRAVDHRAALRFGLDPGRLGPEVTVVGAPPSLWAEHRRELVPAGVAFAALLALSAVLLAVNRRLVLARRALRRESEERERLRLRLEETQRLEAVGRLAGGIAHDLNNLLTPILVSARLAREQLSAGNPVAEDLDTVVRAAERARELTRQVLAFSRRQRLDLRVLDLNEEVRAFHALLPRLIGEDVKVRLSLAPGRLPILGDAGQLQQVMMNLSINARDAMPDGGVLELTTAESGVLVVLSVRDTGVGMKPEVKARAFEPFFTTKPIGQGTGLGLSTSHGIVKQHGGDIEVESDPGTGTTFRITLPRAGPRPAQEAAPGPSEARAGSGTILLVEDEPLVRHLAKRVLTGAGYAVVEAEDGPGAIAAARRLDAVDLLLTDVVMPGIGGRELRERLLAERPGLRVLFMSGYPALPGSGEVLGFGPGDRVLAKPFTAEELLAKVQGVLRAPEGRRVGS